MLDRTIRRVGLISSRFVRNIGGPERRGVAQRAFAAVLAWQERAR